MTTTTDQHVEHFRRTFTRLIESDLLTRSQAAAAVGLPPGQTGPICAILNTDREPGMGFFLALVVNCPNDAARDRLLALCGDDVGHQAGGLADAHVAASGLFKPMIDLQQIVVRLITTLMPFDDVARHGLDDDDLTRLREQVVPQLREARHLLDAVGYRLDRLAADVPPRRHARPLKLADDEPDRARTGQKPAAPTGRCESERRPAKPTGARSLDFNQARRSGDACFETNGR
jgi:hypothetical protein